MKNLLILILAFGLIGTGFADDLDYKGFSLTKTNPSGDPMLIKNCDWDGEDPYYIYTNFRLMSPDEESHDVEMYVYNPITDAWTLEHTCKNIGDSWEDCDFNVPVYWGLSENDENAYIDLVRAEMSVDGETYSKTFNFHVSHKQTNDEEIVLAKIAEFEALEASVECPEVSAPLSSKVADTKALAYECKMSEAKQEIAGAINDLEERIAQSSSICASSTPEPVEAPAPAPISEPEAEEESAPMVAPEPAPAPAQAATEESGGMCAPAFVVLLLAAMGFAMRKN